MGKDSYPVYRRRDDEQVVEVKNSKLDNMWVIPFNPSLFMLYIATQMLKYVQG
jgi:hypothetical protein